MFHRHLVAVTQLVALKYGHARNQHIALRTLNSEDKQGPL